MESAATVGPAGVGTWVTGAAVMGPVVMGAVTGVVTGRAAGRASDQTYGSSNSLVRKIRSRLLREMTCCSQSIWPKVRSAASNSGSASASVMCARSNPRNVRAMSRNQAYWAVLSNRVMCRMIALTRSRGAISLASGPWLMPAEWASSV